MVTTDKIGEQVVLSGTAVVDSSGEKTLIERQQTLNPQLSSRVKPHRTQLQVHFVSDVATANQVKLIYVIFFVCRLCCQPNILHTPGFLSTEFR